ncbi:MAG TPA: hypothetical protein VM008_10195 [Phycisphaerae bacterium]|nr:hypothetical protein [Phycisphaerae bacterium]
MTRKIAPHAVLLLSLALSTGAFADTPITHFTPGDFVVVRGGDDTYSNNENISGSYAYGEVPAYLDEYDSSGNYVGTLPIPSSGTGQLTIPGVGAVGHEGGLDLSPNGQWLTFTGYQFAPNTDFSGATYNLGLGPVPTRIVGEVSVTATSLNTTTVVNAYPSNVIRAAITVDGNEFYVAGKYPNGGLQYVQGTGPNAVTTSSTPEQNYDWRNIEVYNGVLYGSTGSDAGTGFHGIGVIGPLSPSLVSTPTTEITDKNNRVSSSDAAFFNVPTTDPNVQSQNNCNVIYSIGDQYGPAITKYYFDGAHWEPAAGLYTSLVVPTVNPTGILATTDPTNPSWVDIYVSGQSGVYKYIDESGDPTALITANNSSSSMSTFFTPQDSNEAFYGMTMAPKLFGDATLDGKVDLSDLSTVLNNFGRTTSAWTDGNFDGNATIDLTDLSYVLNNFGLSNPNPTTSQLPITNYQLPSATPTPEPTSLALLTLATPLLLKRKR